MKRRKKIDVEHNITELLTDVEKAEIDRLLAIEDVWWGRWHNLMDAGESVESHWCYKGEDGHWFEEKDIYGMEVQEKVLAIDMQDETWTNSVTGEVRSLGWVICEKIIPWEKGVVPTAINWFIKRFFGIELFGYQLFFYYQTTPKLMIVGGRGSAKTVGVAMSMAAWVALHPGQPWAHFAFTGSQALEAYDSIIDLGEKRIPAPGQSEEDAPLSFWDVFVKHHTRSPYAKIDIRSWDIYDSGNNIFIRPLGQARGATTTRGMDVRRASLDEVTYDLLDKSAIGVAEGTVRGVNEYWRKRLDEETRVEVDEALTYMSILDTKQRNTELTDLEEETLLRIKRRLRELRITCHLGAIRTGNRGPALWVDEDLDRSMEHPEEIFARIVSYLINKHLDQAAKRGLELTYSDPAVARVELFAQRAIGRGTWFDLSSLLNAESKILERLMEQKMSEEAPGYAFHMHGQNMVLWELPYDESKIYVYGADAGTGVVPRRDSWNIQVWELDLEIPLARLAYWKWGNLSRGLGGSWIPFIEAQTEALDKYKVEAQNAIIQVGGTEAGISEVAYWEKNRVTSVFLSNTVKAKMANYLKTLLGKRWLKWPVSAADLTVQLSDWELNDKKLTQDLVMATFAASWRMFNYFYAFIKEEEDKVKDRRTSSTYIGKTRRVSQRKRKVYGDWS